MFSWFLKVIKLWLRDLTKAILKMPPAANSTQKAKEILKKLQRIEVLYKEQKSLISSISPTDDEGSDKRRRWQKTANMIFDKIADHKAGNAFLKPSKDAEYSKSIKHPICLETIKSRIRLKKIGSVAEFHRDLMQVIANAVMYNQDPMFYEMSLELKDFCDSEMQNFLILHP
jgi:hypothetical protein